MSSRSRSRSPHRKRISQPQTSRHSRRSSQNSNATQPPSPTPKCNTHINKGTGNAFSRANISLDTKARLAVLCKSFRYATSIPTNNAREHCYAGITNLFDGLLPRQRSYVVVTNDDCSRVYKISKNDSYVLKEGYLVKNWGLSFVPSTTPIQMVEKTRICSILTSMNMRHIYVPNGADLNRSVLSFRFGALSEKLSHLQGVNTYKVERKTAITKK